MWLIRRSSMGGTTDTDVFYLTDGGSPPSRRYPRYSPQAGWHPEEFIHSLAEAEIVCDQLNIRDYGRVNE